MQISAMYLSGPQSFSANKVNQRRRADVNGSFLSQAAVFRDVEIAKHSKNIFWVALLRTVFVLA
jgi:hypothetical protein